MNIKYLSGLEIREKLILSIGVLVASVVLAVILFLEPALKTYSNVLADIAYAKKEIAHIRTADKEIGVKQLDPGRAIIYMYNYMEGVTVNSGVKIKNFQASGNQGTKGMANFQLKLGANALTFAKLLYISENTVPAMSISSFRISSQSGGTYEGLRQLETVTSVAISTKRLGGKTFYADGAKFKALRRDPFAPYEGKTAVKELKQPDDKTSAAENWVLTAAMSDGDMDVLLYKKENGTTKYAVSLKKGGQLALTWSGESVEIRAGEEKTVWVLGEAKAENIIPKILKEAIMNGDTGKVDKSLAAEVPAVLEQPGVLDKNATGPTEEELKKMGLDREPVTTTQPGRVRPARRSFGGNTGRQ